MFYVVHIVAVEETAPTSLCFALISSARSGYLSQHHGISLITEIRFATEDVAIRVQIQFIVNSTIKK